MTFSSILTSSSGSAAAGIDGVRIRRQSSAAFHMVVNISGPLLSARRRLDPDKDSDCLAVPPRESPGTRMPPGADEKQLDTGGCFSADSGFHLHQRTPDRVRGVGGGAGGAR